MRRRTCTAAAAATLGLLTAACGAGEETWNPQPDPVQPGPPSGGSLILDPETVPDPGWADLLIEAGTQCAGLDAPTLAAQLNAESGWDPGAVSPVGAQGLAQFMPGTWAGFGLDGNGDGVADPFDPQDAIPSQALYMCTLLENVNRYTDEGILAVGMQTEHTLAAYNAGMGAVEQYQGIPPFPETQGYVSAIMASRLDYAAGAGGGGIPVEGYAPAPVTCQDQGDPMEAGLQPSTVRGLRCVRQTFDWSTITSGWRERGSTSRSDHPLGLAIDAASGQHGWDTPQGRKQNWQMAHWYQVNADRLGVTYLIFHNYRWPSYDGTRAWVPYDHPSGVGNPSLDHHDHLHISFAATVTNPDAALIDHSPRQGNHPNGIWMDPQEALP